MAADKYKIYCGEKYVADDIGTYLEGGRERCLCGSTFYPPSDYRPLEMKFQYDSINYETINYQKYELQNFENL